MFGMPTARNLAIVVLASLFVVGCLTPGTNLAPKEAAILEDDLARTHRKYSSLTGSRVMAACMDWKRLDYGIPQADFKNYYYVGESSDSDVPISEMLPLALTRCKELKAKRDRKCDCTPYAMNDTIVLRISK